MGARREVVSAVAERYRSARRMEKGAHPRRAVRDDGLASQACGTRSGSTRRRTASMPRESAGAYGRRRPHERAHPEPSQGLTIAPRRGRCGQV
jgi:hypothetical protein